MKKYLRSIIEFCLNHTKFLLILYLVLPLPLLIFVLSVSEKLYFNIVSSVYGAKRLLRPWAQKNPTAENVTLFVRSCELV